MAMRMLGERRNRLIFVRCSPSCPLGLRDVPARRECGVLAEAGLAFLGISNPGHGQLGHDDRRMPNSKMRSSMDSGGGSSARYLYSRPLAPPPG